ncbi:sugar phosphate isomerase/epimerase [Dokdonia sp. Hel_I_63]|jgi:sugar phosphate isomerase/epimerase|uniref:sugar phosphate isomerase/epimerase family protein n=1 Tax=Dokdonia sp. Hel_I_63 TaxID=1249996 RepID=UPI001199CE0A|nr:sugar phosphate isomerase/epimerase family protein [Dokdonia sp. Hel_I_63]TVZ21526.1 sugar phosphate isomerase/epimerase [Dokdonia sp. Hel_I_63]
MKKYLLGTFLCAFTLISCKTDQKKEGDNASAKAKIENTQKVAPVFKHSLAQWSLHKPFLDGTMNPKNFPQIAKDLGFTGVEYVTQLYPELQDKSDYEEKIMNWAREMKEQSDAAGIDNVIIMVDRDGELADPDNSKREEAIAVHKYWMDAARIIGAHSVRANLFGEEDPKKWHEYSVSSLRELSAYGEKVGVNIVIENHGGWSSDGAKLAAVMTEVDSDYAGTLPDFGNFCVKREGGARWGAPCIEEYDIYKGIVELMPFAKGVSAKSYNFDENGNETKLDYARIMQIVADSGFEGYVGTEYEGPLEDPKEGIALTKALVQKSIDNLK